jgi:hypothetical protein
VDPVPHGDIEGLSFGDVGISVLVSAGKNSGIFSAPNLFRAPSAVLEFVWENSA